MNEPQAETLEVRSERSDIERVATAFRTAGLRVVDVKENALLIALETGDHLMVGIRRCK